MSLFSLWREAEGNPEQFWMLWHHERRLKRLAYYLTKRDEAQKELDRANSMISYYSGKVSCTSTTADKA